nr:MAG TPA: hypothetical protein [Caudoviricetes sp.]DAP70303.1 MAG TPA: hypothetical protein [Caudoviricetes sp.]
MTSVSLLVSVIPLPLAIGITDIHLFGKGLGKFINCPLLIAYPPCISKFPILRE